MYVSTPRMLSLQTLAIKSIIKNDIAFHGQHYFEKLIVEFCEKHPKQVPNSPQSYWKLRSSYIFLSERNVECGYLGPSTIYKNEQTFLNDPTNLTTKFINSELKKYVDLNKSNFVSRHIQNYVVPYTAYFEFTPKYINHTGSKYHELGLETTIMNTSTVVRHGIVKHLPHYHSYSFKNNVFADYIYKYKPITYICPKDTVDSMLHSMMAFMAYKNRPIFIFDNDLRFVDECSDQKDCEDLFKLLMERIHWFRTTIHAQFMSELHFMLLDCDITHRMLNIMTLYPTVFFKDDDIKDESPDEVHSDEA
jgi:hypothetical protein